ncbi:asparagine synthase (glutamine-hydrolyzing) [Aureibaculum conchae]|uniref:asparagine synthase (glutamine-hydrolyzing) n=1 Tax=Aureibaculum sp. 2308TA14-22 TaxID=3108392 RepID=UPI003394D375
MCGIAGIIDFKENVELTTLEEMTNDISHRGSDGKGSIIRKIKHSSIGFGHRRLSIIDLSPLGHQPMSFENYEIVFNGEIYNYSEIKEELKILGHSFASNSDTEVILHAYAQWSDKCVDKFIGMFAFAILDKTANEVFLARDRAGVKPLFYYKNEDLFLFGSELKSFHCHNKFKKEINSSALVPYMKYGYITTPNTIFKNTFKLPPGHFLKINLESKKIKIKEYWSVLDCYRKPKLDISYDDAKTKLHNLLKSAFKYRLVSDVPVGIFLSGGIDSSAVASILQSELDEKINTFTIGFENESYNEAPVAKEIASILGTNHTEIICRSDDAKDYIERIPFYYDEPFADSSAIPTLLISKKSAVEVKVVLSADAGDEIFAGYYKYVAGLKYLEKIEIIPKFLRFLISKGLTLFKLKSRRMILLKNLLILDKKKWASFILQGMSSIFSDDEIKNILITTNTSFDNFKNTEYYNDWLSTMQAIDYQTYLVDDILVKVDRATMHSSIEGREPFLDHRIIEYVAQLPSEYKYDGRVSKKILKDIVYEYVPKELIDLPKSGFSIPIYDWLRTDLAYLIPKYINENEILKQGLFNLDELNKRLKSFRQGDNISSEYIWRILVFQMWYNKWMKI